MSRPSRRPLLLALAAVVPLSACCFVTQPWVRPRPPTGIGREVDPARLEAHVRALAERFHPRDYQHAANLDAAAAYLAERFAEGGGRVSEQPFRAAHEARGAEYRNVIASFGPEAGPRIVLGAHYDTAGPQPGADDNASGVAVLLEVARLLGETRELSTRVDLVAYSLEEPPFFRTDRMGSAVHAESLAREGVEVRAMLSIEMVGFFTDEPKSQRFPTALLRPLYPSRGNFIAVIGKVGQGSFVRRVKAAFAGASNLPVRSMNGLARIPGVDFSDHLNYWAHGWTAGMITDTSFYRNDRYHTDRDVPESLDYARMSKVAAGVYQATLALAERP